VGRSGQPQVNLKMPGHATSLLMEKCQSSERIEEDGTTYHDGEADNQITENATGCPDLPSHDQIARYAGRHKVDRNGYSHRFRHMSALRSI
jgi:hypothetical protein